MHWFRRLRVVLIASLLSIAVLFYATAIYINVFSTTSVETGYGEVNRLNRLITCAENDRFGIKYFCRRFLNSGTFESHEIERLNESGQFGIVLLMQDRELAEVVLSRLVAQGVDVNAIQKVDAGAKKRGWTALHLAAFGASDPWEINMLLENGAQADIKDVNGKTALDLANSALVRRPADGNVKKSVELLVNQSTRQ